ncbi:MAG: nicotinate-nucleotide diphosphorylase (carboxylating), partial [Candidatus Omnitrophica bacterium CG11_big_fil_rev_8_21_14_0_20_42_13]
NALREDIGRGDVTAYLLFPRSFKITSKIVAKEGGILCGLNIAERIFRMLDNRIQISKKAKEGKPVRKGQVLCVIRGDARSILSSERTALNFLARMSGVATLTHKYVKCVKKYRVKIIDTRKTTPGLRVLEKYAVRTGGGYNHRMGLWDQVLVKDNHIAAFSRQPSAFRKSKNLTELIQKIRKKVKRGMKIEVEVENLQDFKNALQASPDIIMLDNMRVSDIKKAVAIKNKRGTLYAVRSPKLEVSGGVTLANVSAIAKTGVDTISIGALTHSAVSLDFSLEVS